MSAPASSQRPPAGPTAASIHARASAAGPLRARMHPQRAATRSRAAVCAALVAATAACLTPGPHTDAEPALDSGGGADGTRMVQVHNAGGSAWVRVRDASPAHAATDVEALPVVLVHGYGSRLESFHFVQPALAQSRRTISFDQRGFGKSERCEGEYGVDAHADDLVALLDEEHIARAILVGHSYGAGVVLRVAVAHPERVAGIVLVSPFAVDAQMNDYLAWSQIPGVGEWLFATSYRDFPGEKMQLAFAPSMRDPTRDEPPTAEHARMSGANRYISLAALDEVHDNQSLPGTQYAALATVRGMSYANAEAKYASLRMPITVVWGELDRVTPIRDAPALLDRLPKATRVIRVPGVGHMPLFEQPDVVVAAIESLDARTPAAAAPASTTGAP